ncbi:hypothetical protein LINPERPRIM_LOCUS24972 [Linum perenne]
MNREGKAYVDGVIRDSQGNLIFAYSANIGYCSITRA